MLDGLLVLLSLSIVMAVASLLAGALPLSFSLTQSQLRLISTIGTGVLVGTSLVVIIPEGIETLYEAGSVGRTHEQGDSTKNVLDVRWAQLDRHDPITSGLPWRIDVKSDSKILEDLSGSVFPSSPLKRDHVELSTIKDAGTPKDRSSLGSSDLAKERPTIHDRHVRNRSPHAFVGISLLLGFLLMYLIDKIPQHTTSSSHLDRQPHHISLENFAQGLHRINSRREGEVEGTFDLHPDSQHAGHISTTTGLVIHAAADGIALGASSSTENTRLGFIIFIAIMIHKAPAAFGLTSVLLKRGLSKRAARAHLVIFSLAAPIGALTTWCLVKLAGRGRVSREEDTQWFTGILLLFSAGTFLYVAMHTMQDDSNSIPPDPSDGYLNGNLRPGHPKKGPRLLDTLAAVGGMLIPLLTQYGHHH